MPVLRLFRSNIIANWPSFVSPPDDALIDAGSTTNCFLMVAKVIFDNSESNV